MDILIDIGLFIGALFLGYLVLCLIFGIIVGIIVIIWMVVIWLCALIDDGAWSIAHRCFDRRHILIRGPVFAAFFVATVPFKVTKVVVAAFGVAVQEGWEYARDAPPAPEPEPKNPRRPILGTHVADIMMFEDPQQRRLVKKFRNIFFG